jgi:Protein of unknown function (DUF3325)
MLIFAQVLSVIGMGWLALALDAHWEQVFGPRPRLRVTSGLLQIMGAAALANSLMACFWADHPTMAPLVWIMGLAAAALSIAMLLAWRPRWLGVLVPRA